MRRRHFIPVAAALSLGAQRILGANDRVNVAIIGLGGRGNDHLTEFLNMGGVEISALCDVDPVSIEKAQGRIVAAGRPAARQFSDMRRVFDLADVNAVSMATPNHWHALGAVWAMRAGKDVYCEKPASHDPAESRIMLEAARRHGRMLQIGTQSRSLPHKMEAVELLRSGLIGEVYAAKGICYKRRKSIGHKADSAPPKGVDWDAFLGPAPFRPFNELRFRYNWHWFWDTGNGDLGNQGVHQMDVARWGLGLPDHHGTLRSVTASGGKLVYQDDQETPNTLMSTIEFEGRQLTFEVRGLVAERVGGIGSPRGNCIGNIFYGADGWLELDDWKIADEAHPLVMRWEIERAGDALIPRLQIGDEGVEADAGLDRVVAHCDAGGDGRVVEGRLAHRGCAHAGRRIAVGVEVDGSGGGRGVDGFNDDLAIIVAGAEADHELASYGASKAAVKSLTEALDLEPVKRLLSVMRGDEFHEAIAQIPGYMAKNMGEVRTIPDMFRSAE